MTKKWRVSNHHGGLRWTTSWKQMVMIIHTIESDISAGILDYSYPPIIGATWTGFNSIQEMIYLRCNTRTIGNEMEEETKEQSILHCKHWFHSESVMQKYQPNRRAQRAAGIATYVETYKKENIEQFDSNMKYGAKIRVVQECKCHH